MARLDPARLRPLVVQLLTQPADALESERLEVKSWCKTAKELQDEVVEAASCLANKLGGLVLVGADDKRPGFFSCCPHPDVTPDWLVNRIHDLTLPPVSCHGLDLSGELQAVQAGAADCKLFAISVDQTRSMDGHRTIKGVSKIRVGKECRPQYVAEDDRTAVPLPGSCRGDLSVQAIDWAVGADRRKFNAISRCEDGEAFLSAAGLLVPGANCDRSEVPLATFLLFGKEAAFGRLFPQFETVLSTPAGEERLRRNIIDSIRFLEGKRDAIIYGAEMEADSMLREVYVNAFIHRCYRSNGPVQVTRTESELKISNPGGLLHGLSAGSLLYCTPVYRNFKLAEAARYIGLCDKIGKGINIIFRTVIEGGFDFPYFESDDTHFEASIPLERSDEFRAFARKRAQSLNQLDELVVLRLLWARQQATVGEICGATQRGNEGARRVIREMLRKGMIEGADSFGKEFRLSSVLRNDIATVFASDQMGLFG